MSHHLWKLRSVQRFATIAEVNDAVLHRWQGRVQLSVGCWLWKGTLVTNGYGVMYVEGQQRRAHRLSYEHFIGPIPEGLDLDHLCHNHDPGCVGGAKCLHRRCVNPGHLQPATRKTNLNRSPHSRARRTHCPHGHPYDVVNTYVSPAGIRHCRACTAVSSRRCTAARRANDTEWAEAQRQKGRDYYAAHRERVLAHQQVQRNTPEGKAKRHAAYIARRDR